MSNRPRPTPERRPLTRRQLSAQQREANIQRRVTLILGGILGLALLLIIAGFVYDRVYLPSRAVRQVNNVTLTRGNYEQLARAAHIERMIQTLQFSKIFGANQSFGQGGRFDEQIVRANLELADFGTARSRQQPVDESLVNQWVERQIVEQRARDEFGIAPDIGVIDQRIVAVLGSLIDTPAPMDTTEPMTATATVEPTATGAAGTEVTAEATPEATAAATPEATVTPSATPEPTATPLPAAATQQVEQIVDSLYDEYLNILEAQSEDAPQRQRTPYMTRDDIAQVLRAQFREDVIRELVGERLVPDLASAEEGEPTQINVRHILLRVPPEPTTDEAAETPAAEATTTPEETATPEPTATPTPTPTPEELEQLFAERKREADELYQQLIANPESFPDVARERSEDPGSAAQGGDLGAIDRAGNVVGGQGGSFVPEFVEAAWQLEEGEISEPVRSQFGWHIIQRVPEDPEAKLTRLRNEAFDRWLEAQRQQVTIVPAPTPTPTEIPIPTPEPNAEGTPEATATP